MFCVLYIRGIIMNEEEYIQLLASKNITCEMDGDSWAVHGPEFVNPAESPMGYGYTPFEAALEYFCNRING